MDMPFTNRTASDSGATAREESAPRFLYAGHHHSARPVPFHRHPGTELVLVTSGECEQQIQNQPWVTARVGDLFIIPAYAMHRQRSRKTCNTTYIVFQTASSLPNAGPSKIEIASDDPLVHWLEDLCLLPKRSAMHLAETQSALLQACIHHLRGLIEHGERMAELHPVVERALDRLKDHFAEPLAPSLLARQVGVSVSHLNLLFRKQLGHSPMQQVEILRMEHACRLLRSPYARVGEVAEACGYDDLNYFTRVFKRRIGLPPARWRREYGSVDIVID